MNLANLTFLGKLPDFNFGVSLFFTCDGWNIFLFKNMVSHKVNHDCFHVIKQKIIMKLYASSQSTSSTFALTY